MLDEGRIERLLMELRKAHEEAIKAATAYESALATWEHTKNLILHDLEYEAKFAKERDVEAAMALAQSEMLARDARTMRETDIILARAKVRLEIAREAISLWRALAYQIGGTPE